MKWGLVFILFVLSPLTGMGQKIMDVGNRREFFWDETMIDVSKTTATPRIHEFVRRESVLTHDEAWEGDGSNYHNLVCDNDLYRLYYLGWSTTGSDGIRVCYAESKDGIHWVKPKLGLRDYNGSKENNIILDKTDFRFDNFYVFIDKNPTCAVDEKYKGIASNGNGVLIYFYSSDGINFKKGSQFSVKGEFDSMNVIFWNEESRKYMGFIRDFHGLTDPANLWSGLRDIRYIESEDFMTWSEPKLLDFGDADDYALYTNCVSQYYRGKHVLVGFPTRYVERKEWTDTFDQLTGKEKRLARYKLQPRYGLTTTDCIFMTSRNGYSWKRYDEALHRPGPEEPHNWVYGDGYPAIGMIETPGSFPGTDNEISMFMVANHWMEIPAELYRYTIRTDGFVSYHATYKPQILTTKPFIFEGDELLINFSTSAIGYMYIKIKDENSNEINSYELFGDKIDRQVGFKDGVLSQFKGKPVVMEIKMSDADIYAFIFK